MDETAYSDELWDTGQICIVHRDEQVRQKPPSLLIADRWGDSPRQIQICNSGHLEGGRKRAFNAQPWPPTDSPRTSDPEFSPKIHNFELSSPC